MREPTETQNVGVEVQCVSGSIRVRTHVTTKRGNKMIGCIGHDGDCCKGREQERKDAERYRWLRAANASLDENVPWYVGIDDGKPSNIHWIGSDLDGAIDAAMVGANVEISGGCKPSAGLKG